MLSFAFLRGRRDRRDRRDCAASLLALRFAFFGGEICAARTLTANVTVCVAVAVSVVGSAGRATVVLLLSCATRTALASASAAFVASSVAVVVALDIVSVVLVLVVGGVVLGRSTFISCATFVLPVATTVVAVLLITVIRVVSVRRLAGRALARECRRGCCLEHARRTAHKTHKGLKLHHNGQCEILDGRPVQAPHVAWNALVDALAQFGALLQFLNGQTKKRRKEQYMNHANPDVAERRAPDISRYSSRPTLSRARTEQQQDGNEMGAVDGHWLRTDDRQTLSSNVNTRLKRWRIALRRL